MVVVLLDDVVMGPVGMVRGERREAAPVWDPGIMGRSKWLVARKELSAEKEDRRPALLGEGKCSEK